MNLITGKQLPRRTLLRGAGGIIALPLLDAMRPALAGPSNARQALRIGVVYGPNGVGMNDWLPKEIGKDFAFTRILKSLEPFRDDITVGSGVSNNAANKSQGGGHAKA